MKAAWRELADRDLALRVPLEGVQQIEASAGTGKTYTIAGLYVRLVVERRLPLRQILVMTFTKAATEELRQRLRQRLVLCATLAASPWMDTDDDLPPDLDHEERWALALLRRAVEGGGETPAQLARRLKQAVLGMDEAVIFTIHGFCQRVLREHASLIDGASREAVLEPSDEDLLEDFAADAWLRVAARNDALEREALRRLGADPQGLAKTLRGLVDFHGRIEPLPDAASDPAPPHPAELREAVHAAWAGDGDTAIGIFEAAWEAGHLSRSTYKVGAVAELRALQRELAAGGWPAGDRLARFAANRIAGAVNKNKPAFPGHAAFDAIEAWACAASDWQARVQSRLPVLLHALLDQARAWLRGRKRELARMSYADQIDRVHRGLDDARRGERLCRALHDQYPVALVDEFQDTDARQFEIFRRLYAGAGTLFCIGDPKQAIYGFRGGDVHAYLRARRLAAARWRLDHNFRSSRGLLDACAALFQERPDGQPVFVEEGIGFEPVEWGGKTPDGALRRGTDVIPPMTVWALSEDQSKATKDVSVAMLATACAGEIARLLAPGAATLADRPLDPGQVAVLVNTNDEAMTMQDALAGCGIASVCLRRESVFASREAVELRQILDALLAPRHPGLARGALATHLMGRRLGDLRAMHDEDADWRAELDELRACWLQRGVLAMLERLGERHAQRLLSTRGGERCLSNLMQLGDAIQARARTLADAHAQRDWLARRIAQADEHNEEEQLRLESDAERVQILTLHASKGLEYDLVFLPFAARMTAGKPGKGAFARFHDGDDLVQRLITTDSGDRAPTDADAIDRARREDLAEGVRKLYVGVTRARHACWLSAGVSNASKGAGVLDWVLPEGPEALSGRAGDAVAIAPLPDTAPVAATRDAPAARLSAREFTRVLDRDWRSHSFTRLAEGGHDAPPLSQFGAEAALEPAAGPAVPALGAGLQGSRFGSAVHAILERVDFAAWHAEGALPEGQRALVDRMLAAYGFNAPAARPQVEALLRRTLCTPFLDGLSLATLPRGQRCEEMVFDFGIAGADPKALLELMHAHGYQARRQAFAHVGRRLAGLMNGVIDLVFVHRERWWVVDYKTNHLGDHADDYAPERLAEAVRGSDYDLQYLIYTVALHRWLTQVLGQGYDYARDFGGVRYLFLRGLGLGGEDHGVFVDRPPAELILGMDRLLRAPEVAA